jgi:hypothetical protein
MMARFEEESMPVCERIGAGPALGMALMGITGMTQHIDDLCRWDRSQRKLSPGNGVKALVGSMCTENLKKALSEMQGFYEYAPVDLLLGTDHGALHDNAFGRCLDTLYAAGLDGMYMSLSARAVGFCHVVSKYMHIDPSNVTITRLIHLGFEGIPEDVPLPKLGHPKDGNEGRLQYSFNAAVDENGIPHLFRVYAGNTGDPVMIRDAVISLAEELERKRIIAVADSKMVNDGTVSYMVGHNILFVSKCPEMFADRVRGRVVEEARRGEYVNVGRIGGRKDSPEYEAYDTDAVCNGMPLRFVVYRRSTLDGFVRKTERVQGIVMKGIAKEFGASYYGSEQDAYLAAKEMVSRIDGLSYRWKVECRMVPGAERGGPRRCKAVLKHWFDRGLAEKHAGSKERGVIVTSLPRPRGGGDVPDSASAEDVLRAYFGQHNVERAFSETKSGIGADEVFFQSPVHENAMLFVITVAVLIRGMIRLMLRRGSDTHMGIPGDITAMRAFKNLRNVEINLNRETGRVRLDGPEDRRTLFRTYLDVFGLEVGDLLG